MTSDQTDAILLILLGFTADVHTFCMLSILLKAGFHMIADRRSQIAIRSAIVCDHMETTSAIVCDPAIVIADDRRR